MLISSAIDRVNYQVIIWIVNNCRVDPLTIPYIVSYPAQPYGLYPKMSTIKRVVKNQLASKIRDKF